jgi:hypothetical protein
MTSFDRLSEIAERERAAVTDTVGRLLPSSTRVSVYLYQPVAAEGLRPDSPGVLWDVGPLPDDQLATPRHALYQCAEAGRTGSFLQSAEECTRRVPQSSCIDRGAARSYRAFNGIEAARRAQIAVEQARHRFRSRSADGPPEGYFIHHLALAPSAQSFGALASGRLPVLGTIFTVTEEEHPVDRHEYSNLVDYAIFIAGEALEIRAELLLGSGLLGPAFEESALEELLDDPTSDVAVQLVIKLLFAHHWFFPYDPAASALLSLSAGSDEAATALYHRHGWMPPRTPALGARTARQLHQLVVADLSTLVSHLSWYRLGKEFRPRPGAVSESVSRALLTALLLVAGPPQTVSSYATRRSRARKDDRGTWLGAPAAVQELAQGEAILAPVFPVSGVAQLLRHRSPADGDTPATALARFDASFAVCGPGDTEGHTRTHLKPSRFVEGVDRNGTPRFSARMHESMRERSRWLCSYAIGRLAEHAARERGGGPEGAAS